MQIFVLGMHRSGTSLIARLANLMGAYFGGEGVALPVNDENPKGFWERRDVVALNERLLEEQAATWFDILPVVERSMAGSAAPGPTAADEAVGTLVAELDAHRPWFIKDPRLCLTFSHWRRHCEVPFAVVCLRNLGAIASSMSRRSGLTGLSYDEAVALGKAHLALLARQLEGVPVVVVRYERFLEAPVAETRRLYEALSGARLGSGLRLPETPEVERFVEPALRRSRSEDAFERLSDEFAAAVESGTRVDAWLDEATLTYLRGIRQRRESQARQRADHYAAMAQHIESLGNVSLGKLLADSEAAAGGEPWTFERLRRLVP